MITIRIVATKVDITLGLTPAVALEARPARVRTGWGRTVRIIAAQSDIALRLASPVGLEPTATGGRTGRSRSGCCWLTDWHTTFCSVLVAPGVADTTTLGILAATGAGVGGGGSLLVRGTLKVRFGPGSREVCKT